MPVFTYKCPSCAGPLKFEPNIGKFKCDFCGGTYEGKYLDSLDDKVFEEVKQADRDGEYGKADEGAQMLYSCPSCGAEIVTDQTTAATMCYFCHNPVVLTGRLAADMKPDAVLPFKYDHKSAREKFFSWIKKKRYVPKSFIAEESVKNISGVYYPYWLADYQTEAHFSGEGQIVTTASTATHIITTTKYYRVTRDGDISFRNIQRGALKKADHKLSDGVHPYSTEELINFEPSYLSGFMAEKRDVDADEVRSSVENEIRGYVKPMLTSGTQYTSLSGEAAVDFLGDKYKYALLPAWVLTYKGAKDKMFYYAMNGQSGRVCGVLPVNTGKLLLHCAILAALVICAASAVFYFLV